MPTPNVCPGPGRPRWHHIYACFVTNGRWTPPARSILAPSSLLTFQPQEHRHAGLAKPQTSRMIKSLAPKLRGGGINTTIHCWGRVNSVPAATTSSLGPFRLTSSHTTHSRSGHNNKALHLVHSIGCVKRCLPPNGPGKRSRQTKVSGGFPLKYQPTCREVCWRKKRPGLRPISTTAALLSTSPRTKRSAVLVCAENCMSTRL